MTHRKTVPRPPPPRSLVNTIAQYNLQLVGVGATVIFPHFIIFKDFKISPIEHHAQRCIHGRNWEVVLLLQLEELPHNLRIRRNNFLRTRRNYRAFSSFLDSWRSHIYSIITILRIRSLSSAERLLKRRARAVANMASS